MTNTETTLTPHERRKARARAYYYAHREEMRAQQRAYYHERVDKAAHAARIRKWRHENPERNRAVSRAYRKKNRARIYELEKKYNARNPEKRKQYRRTYYLRHRYDICKYTLDVYTFRSIETIQSLIPDRVAAYIQQWDFEACAHKRILRQLYRYNIYPSNQLYSDCYDAGMIAYLYTIHRCAWMRYDHVIPYLIKMIRILVTCALYVGRETENICQQNGFVQYHLDACSYGK